MAPRNVRLRPVELPGDLVVAYPWYQDPEVLQGSEGRDAEPFSLERIERMYRYLSNIGSVYIIEVWDDDGYRPVGDAALSPAMMPIVIGDDAWRGRGVGTAVMKLIERLARDRGMMQLKAHKIFRTNIASERLFASQGFQMVEVGEDPSGEAYGIWIKDLNRP